MCVYTHTPTETEERSRVNVNLNVLDALRVVFYYTTILVQTFTRQCDSQASEKIYPHLMLGGCKFWDPERTHACIRRNTSSV